MVERKNALEDICGVRDMWMWRCGHLDVYDNMWGSEMLRVKLGWYEEEDSSASLMGISESICEM